MPEHLRAYLAVTQREAECLSLLVDDLLLLFAAYPNRAFSRRFLLQRLWTDECGGLDRTVDAHVTCLRKKLGPFGERIVTVWGSATASSRDARTAPRAMRFRAVAL